MRSFSKISIKIIVPVISLLLLGSCINVLREFGDRSSDEYLIAQTKQLLDAEDFDAAINTIEPVLTTRPMIEEAYYLSAAAYAGRAGLRILDVFLTIATEGSDKGLFEIFAEHFIGADDDAVADIESAVGVLESLSSDNTGRSSETNLFAVFVFYSRIGVTLSRYAYDAEGEPLTNFTACHTAEDPDGVKSGIPNEGVDRVMTSIPKIVDALSGVTIQGGAVDAFRNVDLDGAIPSTPIPCEDDPSDLRCLAVRILINRGPPDGFGLGTGSQFLDSPEGICTVITP